DAAPRLREDVHRAGLRLRLRAEVSPPGGVAHDDARVALAENLVGEVEALEDARTHVVVEDVSRLDQPQEELAALGVLEIDADAALVAVEVLVVAALTVGGELQAAASR